MLGVGSSTATWFDLSDGTSGAAPLPAGLTSYAEIAGGRSITGPDGTAYVVGAGPSATVRLKVTFSAGAGYYSYVWGEVKILERESPVTITKL